MRISDIDTDVKLDPFQRHSHGESTPCFWLNPETDTCGIRQDYPGQVGTPLEEYNGIVLTQSLDHQPSADEAETLLESVEGQAMLARIVDGWERIWNGHNHIGKQTSDSQSAMAELVSALNSLSENPLRLWAVDEWLSSTWLDVSAVTTDNELDGGKRR